jgi:hypothetical protein
MSDILVDIRLVERQAPSTSSQPSLAHPRQWIRSDTRRYTQQGAAFRVLKFVPPTALAQSTSKSTRVPTLVLRKDKIIHRLQAPPSPGASPHCAPQRVRTFMSAVNNHQTQAPSGLSCAANTRNPLRIQLEIILLTTLSPIHTANHKRSTCRRPLTPLHIQTGAPAGKPGACESFGPLQP